MLARQPGFDQISIVRASQELPTDQKRNWFTKRPKTDMARSPRVVPSVGANPNALPNTRPRRQSQPIASRPRRGILNHGSETPRPQIRLMGREKTDVGTHWKKTGNHVRTGEQDEASDGLRPMKNHVQTVVTIQ